MTGLELKNLFLDFFKSKQHTILPSASLLPDNDPTVLFTTAGMHPLVPYLMGEKHPGGKRLASVQGCVRTGDIDEVGDPIHHTFFEMLGNWSLGDYDEKQAVEWAWEFVTQILKLDSINLAVSIFDKDKETLKYWLDLGLSQDRIVKISDNWWGPAGMTGPCGPDTEIFYWTGQNPAPAKFDSENPDWVEIWNNVFMKYNKTTTGDFLDLKQKNIDTGMGLERTLAVLEGHGDNYLTEVFQPIIKEIEKLSGKKYQDDQKSFRIIADHIRSSVMILSDHNKITPSNIGAGYVLRRLIRRGIRFGKILGINQNFTSQVARVITDNSFVFSELEKEENKFRATLEKGLREFAKQKQIDGKTAFILFSTYGFPLEMTEELAQENNIGINKQEFEEEFKRHQELSRTASAGMFKGGLADNSEATKKYHTATHLMLQALRDVLKEKIEQRGSNINAERLRFDFSYNQKMTPVQVKQVEDIVNQKIKANLPVSFQEMTVEQAEQQGAIGVFKHKYGEKVKVYSVGNYSREICGGPHVANTSELGIFKIIKEESVSAGTRRIKAILE